MWCKGGALRGGVLSSPREAPAEAGGALAKSSSVDFPLMVLGCLVLALHVLLLPQTPSLLRKLFEHIPFARACDQTPEAVWHPTAGTSGLHPHGRGDHPSCCGVRGSGQSLVPLPEPPNPGPALPARGQQLSEPAGETLHTPVPVASNYMDLLCWERICYGEAPTQALALIRGENAASRLS